ncbi:MAG TPA: XdhC/CoxI family protein, partial [bacterium]|nr:XdhC/CoxI family protein [bacterium]
IFDFIREKRAAGQAVVLATVTAARGSVPGEPGKKLARSADGGLEGTVGGGELESRVIEAADEVLAERRGRLLSFELDREAAGGLGMLCGGSQDIYLDYIGTAPALVIFGGGHVGLALGVLARAAGFSFAVADDREEFVSAERFPGAFSRHLIDFEASWDGLPVDDESFVVILTRGHAFDRECLERALASPARYIGMIGSERKVRAIFDGLEAKGIRPGDDPRVYSPIGLELGNDSPEEIAVSILAEIVAVKSGGSCRHMRERLRPGPGSGEGEG